MIPVIDTLKFIGRHPLSSYHPIAAYYRYVWWQTVSLVHREIEYKWIDGAKLVLKRGMTGATGNIYCGLHEFNDMAFLLHLLRPGDLFIDAGANIGSYTVLASMLCGAEVIAVEPDPETMRSLRANVDVNRVSDRVQLAQTALGRQEGKVRFTVGQDTMNHVATENDFTTREVPLRRLDDLVAGSNPRLIKMDVEGYEAEVVAGAGRLLSCDRLVAILTESCEAGVLVPLEEHGFRRAFYDPFNRQLSLTVGDVQRGQNNALFVRNIDEVSSLLLAAPRRTIVGVEI